MRDDDVRYEVPDRREVVYHRDRREVDRIAFAMRVLRRLDPKGMTVAVYRSSVALSVQRGRDLRAEGASWAIVGIPDDASRENIAYALAELAGVERVPYAVQMLLADDRNAYR